MLFSDSSRFLTASLNSSTEIPVSVSIVWTMSAISCVSAARLSARDSSVRILVTSVLLTSATSIAIFCGTIRSATVIPRASSAASSSSSVMSNSSLSASLISLYASRILLSDSVVTSSDFLLFAPESTGFEVLESEITFEISLSVTGLYASVPALSLCLPSDTADISDAKLNPFVSALEETLPLNVIRLEISDTLEIFPVVIFFPPFLKKYIYEYRHKPLFTGRIYK